jgi:hypothetical protein
VLWVANLREIPKENNWWEGKEKGKIKFYRKELGEWRKLSSPYPCFIYLPFLFLSPNFLPHLFSLSLSLSSIFILPFIALPEKNKTTTLNGQKSHGTVLPSLPALWVLGPTLY